MRRRSIAAFGVALLLSGSAAIAAEARYPTGRFAVAGTTVPATAVLDARALPDLGGQPSLMVTLAPAVAAALAKSAGAAPQLPVTLDGKPLGASPVDALRNGGVVQVSGAYGGYDAAAALARRISGKDPLPDSEGDPE